VIMRSFISPDRTLSSDSRHSCLQLAPLEEEIGNVLTLLDLYHDLGPFDREAGLFDEAFGVFGIEVAEVHGHSQPLGHGSRLIAVLDADEEQTFATKPLVDLSQEGWVLFSGYVVERVERDNRVEMLRREVDFEDVCAWERAFGYLALCFFDLGHGEVDSGDVVVLGYPNGHRHPRRAAEVEDARSRIELSKQLIQPRHARPGRFGILEVGIGGCRVVVPSRDDLARFHDANLSPALER
jgi:hypothetical protein